MSKRHLGFLTVALALAIPMSAQAQATASITADAQVQVALNATAMGNLDFGAVFPGTTRNVLTSDVGAGAFELFGAAAAEVAISFVLPSDLSDGSNLLPISFGSTSAAHNTVDNRTSGTNSFDPTAGDSERLSGTGFLYVYIGGSVSPTTQPAGSYSGTIQLNAAYTGN